ncbi:hypothetical protein AX16_000206 [Volvariella volvacea WC 439]|nr:hypothetical protein AX16_000206 [Volvariella volvacea WC 439]
MSPELSAPSAGSTANVEPSPEAKLTQGSIIVDSSGYKLFYIDSGAPPSSSNYTTIFAVHGFAFTGEIFRKVMNLAPAANLRIVYINRRNYPGSTAHSATENDIILNGSDAQKTEFLNAQGMQLLTFIDAYILENQLPSITPEKTGGIALILRSVIMLEPPPPAFDFSYPKQMWVPLIDASIPQETQLPFFAQWITAYFKHGDITKRDPSLLSFVVPDPLRIPSIYKMSEFETSKIINEDAVKLGDGIFALLNSQLLAAYHKAYYDQSIRSLLNQMHIWMVTGDATPPLSISTMWSIQDDELARGSIGDFIKYKILKGKNHFVHWDDPAETIEYIQSML